MSEKKPKKKAAKKVAKKTAKRKMAKKKTVNKNRNVLKGKDGLTLDEIKFCELYVMTGHNATKAYRAAIMEHDRPDTDREMASRLIKKPAIKAHIQKLKEENKHLLAISREEMIQYLCRSITTPISLIDEESDLAIDCQVCPKTGIKTIKAYPKATAIDQLKKMNGWDKPQKVEIEGISFKLDLGGK